jgi:hypothetical protein
MLEELQRECRQLRHIVECLMITREGIQELEGDYIELYTHADKYLKNKTTNLRVRKINEKQKADIQSKIEMLQMQLKTYD